MNKKRWFSLAAIWLVATIILSVVAPGAKEFTLPNKNGGLPEDRLSVEAEQLVKEYFPNDEGMPLFGVLYKEEGLTEEQIAEFGEALLKVGENPLLEDATITNLDELSESIKKRLISEDGTTFFTSITLPAGDNDKVHQQVTLIAEELTEYSDKNDVELNWTGPAAIASDAITLFSEANVVLLLATVGLIFVLLLLIYRAPLLTLIPLIGAGIVYVVVDKIIGLSAKAEWFVTESQALSIMTILLFAVVTDYSLLIFSRFREELRRHESVNDAMREAMKHVREPIFFSGSTIVLGMATLFFSLYEPYRNFAPVFAIAAAVMLIAGLTLLPALFAIFGRVAFWPFIPKYGERVKEKRTIWRKVADVVTAKPLTFLIPVVLVLGVGAWNMTNMKTSFDLIESFPEDLSSRVGYERLGDGFSKGSLAPGTLLMIRDEDWTEDTLKEKMEQLNELEGVQSVRPTGHPLAEDHFNVAKLSITFDGNPYGHEAMDTVEMLRDMSKKGDELYIAGETAKNVDIRDINERDTWLVVGLMTALIAIMLGFQTKSIIAPIYMVGSILLSYAATFGFSLWMFDLVLDQQTIGYRIPMYTFVFLVALGVDYSIMLIARIREELKHHELEEAIRIGVERTGGVISSAGLILAATFLVLTTMPVNELKLFGMMMALGILLDTFVVRPIVIPAVVKLLGKWSFWPNR